MFYSNPGKTSCKVMQRVTEHRFPLCSASETQLGAKDLLAWSLQGLYLKREKISKALISLNAEKRGLVRPIGKFAFQKLPLNHHSNLCYASGQEDLQKEEKAVPYVWNILSPIPGLVMVQGNIKLEWAAIWPVLAGNPMWDTHTWRTHSTGSPQLVY